MQRDSGHIPSASFLNMRKSTVKHHITSYYQGKNSFDNQSEIKGLINSSFLSVCLQALKVYLNIVPLFSFTSVIMFTSPQNLVTACVHPSHGPTAQSCILKVILILSLSLLQNSVSLHSLVKIPNRLDTHNNATFLMWMIFTLADDVFNQTVQWTLPPFSVV